MARRVTPLQPGVVHAKTRCGTCKDRKTACDRTLPTCNNCSRAGRVCQGYGLRLSWPRDGDRRRHVVGPAPPPSLRLGKRTRKIDAVPELRLISTSFRDVEIFYEGRWNSRGRSASYAASPRCMTLPPFKVMPRGLTLFEYFESVAAYALVTAAQAPDQLRSLLMRLALSGPSTSREAVWNSLQALACIIRNGRQVEAVELKGRALRALATSAREPMDQTKAVHHVAAGMLLCSMETLQICDTGKWLWYVSGVKQVINAANLDKHGSESDVKILLEWVCYHEVVGKVSLRLWRPRTRSQRQAASENDVPSLSFEAVEDDCSSKPLLRPIVPHEAHNLESLDWFSSHLPLKLLVDVFSTILPQWDPRSHTTEYRDDIEILKSRAERFSSSLGASSEQGASLPVPSVAASRERREAWMAQLYQVAIHICLSYAFRGDPASAAQRDALVDKALYLTTQLGHCAHVLILLLLGCEASTDERRMAVIDLIERTQGTFRARDFRCVQGALARLWVLDDLHGSAHWDLDYVHKMSVVVSMTRAVPAIL